MTAIGAVCFPTMYTLLLHTGSEEFRVVMKLISDGLAGDPHKWGRIAAGLVGVVEASAAGLARLRELQVCITL